MHVAVPCDNSQRCLAGFGENLVDVHEASFVGLSDWSNCSPSSVENEGDFSLNTLFECVQRLFTWGVKVQAVLVQDDHVGFAEKTRQRLE